MALQCLLGDGPFHDLPQPLEFQRLTVELKGFEEWLWLRGIAADRTESAITAAYTEPDKLTYPLDDGELQVVFGLMGPLVVLLRKGHGHGARTSLSRFFSADNLYILSEEGEAIHQLALGKSTELAPMQLR